MKYAPKPINLDNIHLDKISQKDIEEIAKNIHETWGKQRKMQGWEYGDYYDEILKKHPCMVAYEELPESERDVDRATVVQTIKMLKFMGYKIEKGE